MGDSEYIGDNYKTEVLHEMQDCNAVNTASIYLHRMVDGCFVPMFSIYCNTAYIQMCDLQNVSYCFLIETLIESK
jgi:hypothetical protein